MCTRMCTDRVDFQLKVLLQTGHCRGFDSVLESKSPESGLDSDLESGLDSGLGSGLD